MTFRLSLFAATIALATAAAQQPAAEPDRLKVAFRDPARPGAVHLSLIRGSITVKGHAGKEVIVEAAARPRERDDDEPGGSRRTSTETAGLRRIILPSTGLSVEEENNVMKISVQSARRSMDVTLQVPLRTSLKLHAINNGSITVDNVEGDLEVNNINGAVTLTNIAGSAVAHALNGALIAALRKVDPAKPLSFSSLNGKIDVTLPADIKATLNIQSGRGEVFSDFDVVLAAKPAKPVESKSEGRGRYRVSAGDGVTARINGGGQDIAFKNHNGNIYIRKAK